MLLMSDGGLAAPTCWQLRFVRWVYVFPEAPTSEAALRYQGEQALAQRSPNEL